MPKFFCDYCDVYLTHDSMSVRKAHNSGRNHMRNVIDYYQQIGHEKAQNVIDSITNSYADAGQSSSNPILQHNAGAPGMMGGPPPGFPPAPGGFGAPPPGMPPLPPGFPPPMNGMMPPFPPGQAGSPGQGNGPPFMPPGMPPGMPMGMPPGMPQGMPPGMPPNFPPGMFPPQQSPGPGPGPGGFGQGMPPQMSPAPGAHGGPGR